MDLKQSETHVQHLYSCYVFPKRNAAGIDRINKMIYKEFNQLGIPLTSLQGKKILDVGCGTGELSCFLASFGAEVTGIDFSKPSLDYARQTARSKELTNISFIYGSITDFQFPKNNFDLILSHMVLHHTKNPEKAFSNMVQALKPGGNVVFKVFHFCGRLSPFGKSSLWQWWLVRFLGCWNAERRVAIGRKLFYKEGDEKNYGLAKEQYLYDLFGVSIVHHHFWGELLRWMKKNDIQYVASSPSMEFVNFVEPFLNGKQESITRLGGFLRGLGQWVLTIFPIHKLSFFNQPTFWSRAMGQILMLFHQGCHMIIVRGIKTSPQA